MRRIVYRTALLLAVFSPAALAGVAMNAFQQHALQSGGGYLTPPAVPKPVASASHSDAVPPPLPSAVPGADATGFQSAPVPPPAVRQTTMAHHGAPLPPPLPSATVAANHRITEQAPTVPVVPAAAPKVPDLSVADVLHHSQFSRSQQLYVSPHATTNISVDVSAYAPNILVTPFHKVAAISTGVATRYHLFTRTADGGRLIFTLAPHYPVGVVVTGYHSSDPTFEITFLPKNIPGQKIILHIRHWHALSPVSVQSTVATRTRNLTNLMVDAAENKTPSGYSQSRHLPPVLLLDGARFTPTVRYVGLRYTLTQYRVVNLTDKKLHITPSTLYRSGVLAVAFWPNDWMYGHGSTKLFLITHRNPQQGNYIGFVGRGS